MLIRDKDKVCITNIANATIKQPCKILAYGSRVNGTAHDMSDLDLVIISDEKVKIDINDFLQFKQSLQKSNIPILVQVLDWYRIPESFHKNILEGYEEIIKIERDNSK